MENAINTLRIQNFKSIKDVTMQPRRVNLIIGPPNVGKSNILEAMSLLGAGLYDRNKKFMDAVIRYESIFNIFYDNDFSQLVVVNSDKSMAVFKADDMNGSGFKNIQVTHDVLKAYKHAMQESRKEYNISYDVEEEGLERLLINMIGRNSYVVDAVNEIKNNNSKYFVNSFSVQSDGSFHRLDGTYYENASLMPKTYVYTRMPSHSARYRFAFLEPPFGENLLEIVQRSSVLREDLMNLFKPYGLNIVLRISDRKFEIQKNINGFIYDYPYSSIADTLQRIIFYLAAIESNDDAVILFEEPEAHSYPQYVSMLGKRIAASRNNQFFVATHSPYLLTEILEQMLPDEEQASELAIFVAYYEDYQTKVKQLSDEEMRAIRGDSVDVFYNMNRYIPRPANG